MKRPAYLPAAKLVAYLVEAVRDGMSPPQERCSVFYTRCATAALAMPVLRRLRPGPRPLVVFEAHEYPRDQARAEGLRHVDAIVAITRGTAEELRTALGFPADRILVAPDGVPDAWLDPIEKEDARRRLGMRPERPLVVYTGRLHPDTVPLLLETAEGLRDRADLVLVGAPPGEPAESREALEQLREQARSRGLVGVQFVGPVRVEDVRLYQSAADILIAPYSGTLRWARYASPLKIFEYMAAGRPMVVSDLPVLHEVLEHEVTAWLVPAADGAAMAAGVSTLLDRPDLAARIGRRAREEAPKYAWSRRAKAIVEFIEHRPWEPRRPARQETER
jgi:glycosyltransferase involved in cell wall biosynthesis